MSIENRFLHTLVVKRMAPAIGTAAETAGGLDTTLTADTEIGWDMVYVDSAGSIVAGEFLRLGASGHTEVSQVEGVAGHIIGLQASLTIAHASGEQVRQVDDAGVALDDYGQPVMTETTVATVKGLVQPRSAREVAQANQAGAVIGDYVGYMAPLAALTPADWIEHDGIRYDVLTIPDAAGLGHHFELGLRRVY